MSAERWQDLSLTVLLRYLELIGVGAVKISRISKMTILATHFFSANQPIKYGDRTIGQLEALENILGSGVVDGLLTGKLTVRVVGNEVVIEPAPVLIFDKHGRRIPPAGLLAKVCDANYGSAPTKLGEVSCAARQERLKLAFGESVGLIATDDFERRIAELVGKINADATIKNVLNGSWYPICIPGGLGITPENYGEKLDNVIVPAAKSAYERAFSERTFRNNLSGQLAGEVRIFKGSRHEKLLEAASKEPVVGIYFPTALQGYSINADREQMASLPEMFWLTGGLDALVAQIMYPNELLRDSKTLYYEMPASPTMSA